MVLSDQDSCLGWLLQNFALNVAEHGFKISVYNRSYEKTEAAVKRANKEGKRLRCRYFPGLRIKHHQVGVHLNTALSLQDWGITSTVTRT